MPQQPAAPARADDHALTVPAPAGAGSVEEKPEESAVGRAEDKAQAQAQAKAGAAAQAASDSRVLLHMPVDVRSISLAVLATIATLLALQWAKEIVIPIFAGILISYALTPLVNWMGRWHVPRGVAATLVLSTLAGLVCWGVWSLSDQANALVESLPQVTQRVRQLAEGRRGSVSTLDKVQRAATELEAAANAGPSAAGAAGSAASGARPQPATRSRAAAPPPAHAAEGVRLDVRGYLLSGTLGAMAFLGQITVIFFIALFLMASGKNFRRKIVKLAGPTLTQKKVTIETLDEITTQIQRYLLLQLATSGVVGVATGLAFYAVGLEQAAVWGVLAGVTNLIPYVGALIVAGGASVVALVQFGTVQMAALVGGLSFLIHAVVGNVLTPLWMGRASRMSPVAVFIAVLVFGWLWGVWGLLLGVPVLMALKAVCDRVEDLKPIGELLGD